MKNNKLSTQEVQFLQGLSRLLKQHNAIIEVDGGYDGEYDLDVSVGIHFMTLMTYYERELTPGFIDEFLNKHEEYGE